MGAAMFRNYLAATLRNALRERVHTTINLLCLTIGLVSGLLVALIVLDEYSYDVWVPGHERTFLATYGVNRPGMSTTYGDLTPMAWAGQMAATFPGIQTIARLTAEDASLRQGSIEANEKIYWADPDFFSVLPLPVVDGDPAAALQSADGLVVTRRAAQKYFGTDAPIGRTIEINRSHVMRVMGVIEDIPSNSHLALDFIGSGRAAFSAIRRLDTTLPGRSIAYTYFRLKPRADISSVQRGMPDMFAQFNPGALNNPEGVTFHFPILALSDIHFAKGDSLGMKPRGNETTTKALAVVGCLIILAASINFINIMTARAARRSAEVSVRKVSGADRRSIFAQFVGEMLAYTCVSSLFAVAGALIALPTLSSYLQSSTLAAPLANPTFWLAGVSVVIVVGLLAGFYPAIVLSGFHPVALKNPILTSGSTRLRGGLVMIQFAILIGLVLSTIAISRQMQFALQGSLRLKGDQSVVIAADCREALLNQIRSIRGIASVACSSPNALNFSLFSTIIEKPDGQTMQIARAPVGFGLFELLGFNPVAGRFFETTRTGDIGPSDNSVPFHASLVINEAAVRVLGFTSPQAAIGQSVNYMARNGVMNFCEIIGVVPDFAADGVHRTVTPTVYFVDPQQAKYIVANIEGANLPEVLMSMDDVWAKVGEPRPMTRFFLNDYVQSFYRDIERQGTEFRVFTGVAIIIAALGLFGLAAFTTEQRTKEIGIRKTMGASGPDVLRLLLWQFTKPVLWANLIAWPVAYFIMKRWLDGFAYHIDLSLWMFLAASALALLIALLTVAGHALLVARAQPVTALRYE